MSFFLRSKCRSRNRIDYDCSVLERNRLLRETKVDMIAKAEYW